MYDVAGSLGPALERANETLLAGARSSSRAQTPFGPQRSDAAMARVAHSAIFAEALLNAIRERLAEIKSVTHG